MTAHDWRAALARLGGRKVQAVARILGGVA